MIRHGTIDDITEAHRIADLETTESWRYPPRSTQASLTQAGRRRAEILETRSEEARSRIAGRQNSSRELDERHARKGPKLQPHRGPKHAPMWADGSEAQSAASLNRKKGGERKPEMQARPTEEKPHSRQSPARAPEYLSNANKYTTPTHHSP